MAELSEKKPFKVTKVTKKERRRNPAAPFTTSSLQQDASNRLNFRTRKTMMVAQQLYEGVSLGRSGSVGLITYAYRLTVSQHLLKMRHLSSLRKSLVKNTVLLLNAL